MITVLGNLGTVLELNDYSAVAVNRAAIPLDPKIIGIRLQRGITALVKAKEAF
jgi:hypothetical protein